MMFSIRNFVLITSLFSIINISIIQATLSTNSTPTLLAEQPSKECPVSCSNNRAGAPRRPVCGSDGRTYPSACHLRRAHCQQPGLSLKHRGKCKGGDDKPCWADRKFHLDKRPAPPVSMFTPACRSDGRYSPVQCFEVYCWCVDPRSGKPIPNTSVENAKPNCNRVNRRRNGGGPGGRKQRPSNGSSASKDRGGGGGGGRKNKRACGRPDRTTFNKNMLDTFKMEFRRLPSTALTDNVGDLLMDGPTDSEMQRRVLDWKFTSLDMNGDQQLERNELRGLRRLVRKVVPPRRCARTFTRTCDLNHDEMLSREEWTACLGLDFNTGMSKGGMFPPPTTQLRGPPSPPPPLLEVAVGTQGTPVLRESALAPAAAGTISSFEDDSSGSLFARGPGGIDDDTAEEHGCLADRQTVLDEQNSNLNLYIPECTTDGRYQKTQCYTSTGYCFCVDEDTGKVMPGTSVKNGDPKCDSIIPPLRPMSGCPEPKRQVFLKELMEFLNKRMPITILSTNSSESLQEDEEIRLPTISPESIANYHFRLLDKNKDKALIRPEWKAFRALVESQPSLRHCGKKLPRYCDMNRDHKISMTEWLLCLGISGQPAQPINRAPSATTQNPQRKGPNPIESFLKPE